MTQPWFDEVGLAYATHYAEMDEAWSSFRAQRDAILKDVARTVSMKLAGSGAPTPEVSGAALAVYWDGSAWSSARQAAGRPNSRCAFVVGLGTFTTMMTGKTFSFVAYSQCQMASSRFKRVPQELRGQPPLEATCTGSWTYFPYVVIPIGTPDFAHESFVGATEAALERFSDIDARLGAWYASTRAAADTD